MQCWHIDHTLSEFISNQKLRIFLLSVQVEAERYFMNLDAETFKEMVRMGEFSGYYDPNGADQMTDAARELREHHLHNIKFCEERLAHTSSLPGNIDRESIVDRIAKRDVPKEVAELNASTPESYFESIHMLVKQTY